MTINEAFAFLDSEARYWRIHRGRKRGTASFSAWTFVKHEAISVAVRTIKSETIESLIIRGVIEMQRRMTEGMPITPASVVAQRERRREIQRFIDSPIVSKHVN